MSNLTNDNIKEHIFERLKYIYDNDDTFNYRLNIAAEKHADHFIKDDYSEICFDFLCQIADRIYDNCEESYPYFDYEIEEKAYLFIKGEK